MDFIRGQKRKTEEKGQYKILWGVLAAVVIWSVLSAAAYLGLGFMPRAW